MKRKKIFLMFSMLSIFFCLTACGSGTGEVNFDYDELDITYSTLYQSFLLQNSTDAYTAYLENSEDDMADVLLNGVNNFNNAKKECGDFKGYNSEVKDQPINFEFTRLNSQEEDQSVLKQELYDFVSSVDATIEEDGTNVIVSVTAVYDTHEVEYKYVYEENPAHAYSYELTGQDVAAYQVKEITATPIFTRSEIMKKAGSNTLMGMGTVFAVLLFISLVISQFGRIAKINAAIENRKKKEDAVSAVSDVKTVAPVATTNPMDDSQLVAVITAAIVADSVSSGGSDQLVVRSIKKAKR